MKVFLTERSVKKINILRGDYMNELDELVCGENVPSFLGGLCEDAPYGGSVEIAMLEHVRRLERTSINSQRGGGGEFTIVFFFFHL